MGERLPVLYDADCGFCRATLGALLLLDRRRRLRPVPLIGTEADELLGPMPREERLAAMRVAPADGRPLSGGAGLAGVLRELPGGSSIATVLERRPELADRLYAWVADNRGRLSRLVPRRARDRADALIAERAATA